MIQAGKRYEFRHRGGNFSVDIVRAPNLKYDDLVGVIAKSDNSNYRVGDTFVCDSPLTITYREVYPEERNTWHNGDPV
jgi:hypothetical protein